jgi:dimethylaniline monooxygenase (N-oxide forming)
VEYRDLEDETHVEAFDSVLICTGHHARPNIPPPFPNQERFKGRIIHSHSYKEPSGCEDSVAVVVGVGNSGMDVAAELSRVAREAYLSTRRGVWVLSRLGNYGVPGDLANSSRLAVWQRRWLPMSYIASVVESRLEKRFDHALYGLKPAHRVFAQHPSLNDELPTRIISGMLKV